MDIDLLKNIVDKLDEEGIRYSLCFTVKDNDTIKILIDESVDFDSVRLLFDIDTYKQTKKFLRLEISSFNFIFVKTDPNNFGVSTYYYSWGTLVFMLIHIFRKFNIIFHESGLFYNYGGRNIYLTNNIHYILDFLQLDVDIYRKGFKSQMDEFKYVMTSPYMSSDIFKDMKIADDSFFKEELVNILKFINENSSSFDCLKIEHDFVFDDPETYYDLIEAFFPGFLEKLYKIKTKIIIPSDKLSELKGKITNQTKKEIDNQISKLRDEWDRG